MATLRRLECDDLKALLHEAASKYSDWFLVGKVPATADGPPYVLLIRNGPDPERECPNTHAGFHIPGEQYKVCWYCQL